MLPDIGGTELLVIAAVALIVVGPKDLPALLRKLGQFVGRMRGMASEFRASFDEMARQSELDELRREVQAMRAGQFANPVQAATDAGRAEVDGVFADIDASLSSGATQMHPYAGGEIHNPALTTDNSILPPQPAAEIVEKPKRVARKKAVAEPAIVEPAKPVRRAPASKKDITVEAPKAARAPRKRAAKAGGSTASDIVS
ncbi:MULTISPECIES: Sec-independent protein translocase protein TatB [unclassified Caulobacter]|uniref:Sec-independent protein translocase protein TatB n=1 Tax=unclassified Caulobacter TaxID=2648921 RepID=UPI0006F4EF10|nr:MULTISPECIES: Sec-independent protein translocase protein TatB [unclassified Caulobacter]KQV58190.1 preprotein translocase subunit TatB [Caulobacter sp. Root342]KQV69305.1 preprotein translocase subunit TatB [Caulobacter sp. Root343]